MQAVFATLAEHASVKDGLLFVTAGTATASISPVGFPSPAGLVFALELVLSPDELGRELEVTVTLRGYGLPADAAPLMRAEGQIRVEATPIVDPAVVPARVPIAIDMRNVALPAAGVYEVLVSTGATTLATVRFLAVDARPSSQPPARGPRPKPAARKPQKPRGKSRPRS